MHMADALLDPAVAGAMYACSAVAAGYAVKKVRQVDDPKRAPVMGVMGAFAFAAQMINFTIPGTGSSGHLCGGMLLAAVLGPEAGFLTMIGVLLIQCLIFADGGLLALGANVWNMAFYGCFVGGMVIWRLATRRGLTRGRIVLAAVLGGVISLQLGAFSVVLETLASGVTELPFALFAAVMQPIHLAIGLVEGVITAAVLVFLYEARPELLQGYRAENCEKEGKLSAGKTVGILAAAALVIGALLSRVASSNPDGLEWSIEKVAQSGEIEAGGGLYRAAESIQNFFSILPDYALRGNEAAGGSLSGVLGAVLVTGLCVLACYGFKFFRKQ